MTLEELLALEQSGQKAKPKRRHSQPEHRLQTAEVEYVSKVHPSIRPLFFAVPNGGKRKNRQGRWMIEEGLTSGVADIILLVPNRRHPYLCIENKTPTGRQSPAQKLWQTAVEAAGGKYVIVRSVDEFISVIEQYLDDHQ